LNNVDFPTFGKPTIPAFIFDLILRLQRYAKNIIIKRFPYTILIYKALLTIDLYVLCQLEYLTKLFSRTVTD